MGNLISGGNKDDMIQQFLLESYASILGNKNKDYDLEALKAEGKSFSSLGQF